MEKVSANYKLKYAIVSRKCYLTTVDGGRIGYSRLFCKRSEEVNKCEFAQCPYCASQVVAHNGEIIESHMEHVDKKLAKSLGCPFYNSGGADNISQAEAEEISS